MKNCSIVNASLIYLITGYRCDKFDVPVSNKTARMSGQSSEFSDYPYSKIAFKLGQILNRM